MKIKYTGPKEIISAHGVSFKKGKDDKYVYIYPAFQIYNAIHHDYEKNTIYTHNIEGKRLDNESLLNKILNINEKIKENFEKDILLIDEYLQKEIEEVKNTNHNKEEQEIFKNNLVIMKSYRKQREINKTIYKYLIEIIVDDICKHKIREINAPFNERFWHLFQTIQGGLSNHHRRSIGSKLDVIHKNEGLSISLAINAI